MLTRDAQQRPTRHEAGQMRASREELGDDGRRSEQVLEVVEDQQGILPMQDVRDPILGVIDGRFHARPALAR